MRIPLPNNWKPCHLKYQNRCVEEFLIVATCSNRRQTKQPSRYKPTCQCVTAHPSQWHPDSMSCTELCSTHCFTDSSIVIGDFLRRSSKLHNSGGKLTVCARPNMVGTFNGGSKFFSTQLIPSGFRFGSATTTRPIISPRVWTKAILVRAPPCRMTGGIICVWKP